jgi:N-acetylneuraminic acid mutarotase
LPEPRSNLAAAVYEGEIYAIGGETTTGVTGAVTRYNPLSDTWESLSPKPLPVADIGAAVVGGKIYVPGGRTLSGQPTNDLEIYNPRQDRWEKGASLPFAISGYAIATIEGKIYLFGGWDGKDYLSSVFEYDPEQDVWRERTPMPTARAYAGAAVAGGKIYVVGGFDGKEALAVNEAYSPERDDGKQDPWENRAQLPSSRYNIGITNLAEQLYVWGGLNVLKATLVVYLPNKDSWQLVEYGRDGLSISPLVALDSSLFFVGGKREGSLSGQLLSYRAIYMVSLPLLQK